MPRLLEPFHVEDFDHRMASTDGPPTPRLVVANVNNWNFSKGAFLRAHSPVRDDDVAPQIADGRKSTSRESSAQIHGRQSSSRPPDSSHLSSRNQISDRAPTKPSLRIPQQKNIGVAIGSPSEYAIPSSKERHSEVKRNQGKPQRKSGQAGPQPRKDTEEGLLGASKRGWGSVRGLFGRKKDPPEIRSRARPESKRISRHFHQTPVQASLREHPVPVGVPWAPHAAAQPAPPPLRQEEEDRRKSMQRRPSFKRVASASKRKPRPPSIRNYSNQTMLKNRESKPRLNIDIPTGDLGRYSSLFMSVNQPNHPAKAPQPGVSPAQNPRHSLLKPDQSTSFQNNPANVSKPLPAPLDMRLIQESAEQRPASHRSTSSKTVQLSNSARIVPKSPCYSLFPKPKAEAPSPTLVDKSTGISLLPELRRTQTDTAMQTPASLKRDVDPPQKSSTLTSRHSKEPAAPLWSRFAISSDRQVLNSPVQRQLSDAKQSSQKHSCHPPALAISPGSTPPELGDSSPSPNSPESIKSITDKDGSTTASMYTAHSHHYTLSTSDVMLPTDLSEKDEANVVQAEPTDIMPAPKSAASEFPVRSSSINASARTPQKLHETKKRHVSRTLDLTSKHLDALDATRNDVHPASKREDDRPGYTRAQTSNTGPVRARQADPLIGVARTVSVSCKAGRALSDSVGANQQAQLVATPPPRSRKRGVPRDILYKKAPTPETREGV